MCCAQVPGLCSQAPGSRLRFCVLELRSVAQCPGSRVPGPCVSQVQCSRVSWLLPRFCVLPGSSLQDLVPGPRLVLCAPVLCALCSRVLCPCVLARACVSRLCAPGLSVCHTNHTLHTTTPPPRHKTCNRQHATFNMQHATCNYKPRTTP
jgi:hypothetical protein